MSLEDYARDIHRREEVGCQTEGQGDREAFDRPGSELEEEEVVMAYIIFAANILCKKKGVGFSGDEAIKPISKEARELLSLNEEGEGMIMEALEKELKEAEAFINMPQ